MRSSLVLAALATTALAAPNSNLVLHEKRNEFSLEWSKRAPADASQILPVRIGLRQRNLEEHVVEGFINDVSHPESPNYGKHWTPEQIAETFAPSRDTTDTVLQWLADSGVSKERISLSAGRNWVEFKAPIHEVESLFNTKYHFFEHQASGGFRVACDEYHLPKHVQEHVDFAMPTIQLDGMRPIPNIRPVVEKPTNLTGLTGLANCFNLTTIDCLRASYNFTAPTSAQKDNELGIAEWADYLYYPDLDPFFANFTGPNKVPAGTRPDFISIDGGKMSNLTQAEEGNVIESALDFQTAYSIIYPQKIRQYQLGDGVNVDSVGTFNIFLDALDASYCTYMGGDQPYVDPEYPDPNLGGYTGPLQCGGAPISNVFSFSYGQIEGALPRFYQQRQCNEWMKLGLQGVSMIFASGDSGVANRYNAGYPNSCLNEYQDFVDNNGTRYSPSFPVNCPYITAVGATQYISPNISQGERAVDQPNPASTPGNNTDFYSGGGFSNVFTPPKYQAAAVKNYLAKYAPNYGPNVYNASGRGFPDVSAIGLNLATVYLNHTIGVGGTSASTPIFASLINLINDARIAAGKKAVGFVNPTLYAHPEAFNDVTIGSNPGCNSGGFKAEPGWDPVTGLGTPRFDKLKEVFMALP